MLDTRYSTLLRVAIPLMLSSFIQSVVLATDSMFLARHSILAFDAAGSAGLWYITLHMAFIGMGDGAQILIARHIGARDPKAVAGFFQAALFNHLIIAILLTLVVQTALPGILNSMVHNKTLASAELSFLEIRSYAFWASVVSLTIQSVYFAAGKTTIVLINAALVAVSNIILDYLFIFGAGSIPSMGLEGAAMASTLSEVFGMLFLTGNLLAGTLRHSYPFWRERLITLQRVREHLYVGFPLLLQGLVALSVWTIFFIWIEQTGSFELTVSLNIRSVYFLAFVPIWGFAAATKTYIAQYLGAKDYAMLPVIQRRIQLLTIGFLVLLFHGALLYPEWIIRQINPNEIYLAESARILRIVSGSVLIYGMVSVYFQTISGSGNTRVTFLVECIATFLYLGTAFLLIKYLKVPIHQVWLVEYVYFLSMGAASIVYLRYFNWTKELKAT